MFWLHTCDHCRCFHRHQFSFFNGFAWNVYNLKTPFKEPPKNMIFWELFVDKQVVFISLFFLYKIVSWKDFNSVCIDSNQLLHNSSSILRRNSLFVFCFLVFNIFKDNLKKNVRNSFAFPTHHPYMCKWHIFLYMHDSFP